MTLHILVMAALGAKRQRMRAIQSAHVRAPEDSFVLLDGRVKPGHDDKGKRG
jgi:hypothetical protein